MNLHICNLTEKHLPMVDAFSCVENPEHLKQYNSKERRRFLKHSKEMESFLKFEAYEEQEKGLNTTHLFIDKENEKIAAYISLCNDSIRLDFSERDSMGYSYTTIPALKIARLAVASSYQHCGIGKLLIHFSAYIGMQIRKRSGIAFLTLDCYAHRVSFYESIGFVRNMLQPITLPYDTPISMRLVLKDYLAQIGDENEAQRQR